MERLKARLARLQAATEQVEAKIKSVENSLRARQRKAERAEDTRRRLLLGTWLLQRMRQDDALRSRILRDLDTWLTRDDDRQLFDLAPRSKGPDDTPEAGKAQPG